ncbi:MAG: N-acetylmuramate alpha-1-phosphate uridylyltransferase MurU [Gammaproteobacteria bacterium]
MKAMILAAGRGDRMRPLTDRTPKPLLAVGGKPIIVRTIEALAAAGITDLVINVAHLGSQIVAALGTGAQFGVNIVYSDENAAALETAGGIVKALPLLDKQPFLVVNGDIACDYPFARLRNRRFDLAHLVLVANPEHHPNGDFGISNGWVKDGAQPSYTYSGIGLYSPELFAACRPGKVPLAPLLRTAMRDNRISGEYYAGFWTDIGTPQRLHEIDQYYRQRRSSP